MVSRRLLHLFLLLAPVFAVAIVSTITTIDANGVTQYIQTTVDGAAQKADTETGTKATGTATKATATTVSYTHLDVYKRQVMFLWQNMV